MLKKVFTFIELIGIISICVLSFIIPKNPFEIIPSLTMTGFDKLLWLCIFVVGTFFYVCITYSIYNYLNNK